MNMNVNDIKGLLNSVPVFDMVDIQGVREAWIRTYVSSHYSSQNVQEAWEYAEARWNVERGEFIKLLRSSDMLAKCDRFTLYNAWIELATEGLSLCDDLAYIYPHGNKALYASSWKGKLELMSKFPSVVHMEQPQVVYASDEFRYTLGMNKDLMHVPNPRRDPNSGEPITHVYLVVHFNNIKDFYIMPAAEVLDIRNQHSPSYKKHLIDEKNVVNGKIRRGTYEVDYKPPMWVTNEAKAFKKTLVNQVYSVLTGKLPDSQKVMRQRKLQEEYAAINEMGHDIDDYAGEMSGSMPADLGSATPPDTSGQAPQEGPTQQKTRAPRNTSKRPANTPDLHPQNTAPAPMPQPLPADQFVQQQEQFQQQAQQGYNQPPAPDNNPPWEVIPPAPQQAPQPNGGFDFGDPNMSF